MNLAHFGLQRSGTNFLEQMLKRKYHVTFVNNTTDRASPLHKHFRLYDQKDVIPEPQFRNHITFKNFASYEEHLPVVPDFYVIISKDPYSWLLSYRVWAKRCGWPRVDHHYIHEYNLFYGKWQVLSEETPKILFVRYIDLLRDPDEELRRLEGRMGLTRRFFYPFITSYIRKVEQSEEFSSARREYYLNRKYMGQLTSEEIQEVNALIDEVVLAKLGYRREMA